MTFKLCDTDGNLMILIPAGCLYPCRFRSPGMHLAIPCSNYYTHFCDNSFHTRLPDDHLLWISSCAKYRRIQSPTSTGQTPLSRVSTELSQSKAVLLSLRAHSSTQMVARKATGSAFPLCFREYVRLSVLVTVSRDPTSTTGSESSALCRRRFDPVDYVTPLGSGE